MSIYGFKPNVEDAAWVRSFVTLYTFLGTHPKSEDATLLLSTCRNAYLTINAEFADIQELLGGAEKSPLRAGLEMIDQGSLDGPKINDRFRRALGTIAHFDDKERVWATRVMLHESILQLFAKYEADNELDAISIRDIVHGTDFGPSDPEDGRHAHLLRLDLAEQPHLSKYFDALKRLRALSEAIARFGMSYASTIVAPPPLPTTADLFADGDGKTESEVKAEATSETIPADCAVAFWAEKIARNCGWETYGNESELCVKVEFKHQRPDSAVKKIDYAFKRGTDDESIARADAVTFLREALWCAHGIASAVFKPNISSRPMPSVFEIALPVKRPVLTNPDIKSLELHRKTCAETHRMPDTGRVALAHLAVPVSKLNLTDYAFKDNATRDEVEADISKAVLAAKTNSCQALAFPEYSIPNRLRNRLLEIASDSGVTIIGGFEGSWIDGKLADEVFVAIPGEPNLYSQYKHSPSLEEQLPGSMFHDGALRLFTNSPIGDFAVVVCSDFLETATLDAWSLVGPLPDILFVVARNTYPDLYKHFAVTDSFRLYCSVAVCNVLDGNEDGNDKTTSDGTFVVSPRNDGKVDVGADVAVAGTYLKKITVHDIPFSAIRARERGKPVRGFFAVPRSARRA